MGDKSMRSNKEQKKEESKCKGFRFLSSTKNSCNPAGIDYEKEKRSVEFIKE